MQSPGPRETFWAVVYIAALLFFVAMAVNIGTKRACAGDQCCCVTANGTLCCKEVKFCSGTYIPGCICAS